MNALLVLIILGIACGAICVRKSPDAMYSLAAWLMTTADADRERKRFHAERHQAYKRQLGIGQ